MSVTGINIKYVYLPYLAVSLGTILIYTLLSYTLYIELEALTLKDDIRLFWILVAFPWIPVLIWLRRRIRFLRVSGNRGRGYFGYQILMAMSITITIGLIQRYIERGSFDLITIDSIAEIDNYPSEKYFQINSFMVNNYSVPSHVLASATGEYEGSLTYHLYLACPFQDAGNVWYGIGYSKRLDNRLSNPEKEAIYKRFIESAERSFKQYAFTDVSYFEKLGYSDDRDAYMLAIKKVYPGADEAEQVILIPNQAAFEDRLGTTLPWIFGSFAIGAFVMFFMVVVPRVDEEEWRAFKNIVPRG